MPPDLTGSPWLVGALFLAVVVAGAWRLFLGLRELRRSVQKTAVEGYPDTMSSPPMKSHSRGIRLESILIATMAMLVVAALAAFYYYYTG